MLYTRTISLTIGYRYFGRKPTSVNSESNVRIGQSAMPWHSDEEDGKVYKYQYHPHGDTSQPLRNAPSAMNTVIVPDVTLPEVWAHHPCPLGSPGPTRCGNNLRGWE